EWQELQIRIQAPRFENGEKTKNARIVSMTLNGHVVRADREVEGPSAFGLTGNESATGPVLLQGDHGPVAFRKIRVSSPQAVALLDRVNDAFKKASRAPERIEKLIDDLNGTPEEREVALIQLRSHALVALPHLLKKLGQPESEAEKDLVLYALTRLGSQIAAPLVASIETPDTNLRTTVIEALGYVGDHSVIPHLWYHAYSTDQPKGVRMAALSAIARLRGISPGRIERLSAFRVSAKLADAARAHFSGRHTWTDSEQGQIEFWFWNREANTVESRQVSPQAASLYVGTEFARQALALAPERKDVQALYLAMSLGSAAAQAGSAAALATGPGTVFDLALTTGAPTITEALRISQQNANTPAILATLRLLAQQGAKYRQLQQRSHRMPLLTALNYPDRQIQFAAASTILQIDPERSFSGSSRVVDILIRTLSDTGTPGGLVVDASTQRGTTVAAALSEQGYAATTAATGQAGFALAAKRNEIEIILLQYNTIKWGVTQTVANLRADARTASIPIAIYGPDTSKHDVQHILDDYPAVTFILETADSTDLRRQLAPFLAGVRTPAPTAKQRVQQKREAASWFFYIASGRRTAVYNIRPAESVLFNAAHDPETADDALFALGAISSSTCQGHLSDLVINTTLPVETRELAALQLASQTQRNASTLSDEELHAIRKTWQSASSTELRTALASVVGALQPDAKLVGRRLERLPRPQPPAPTAP
ncbi:MAG: hypothetical protein CMJ48_06325, partial [Planctomycetaceae bacterium]|nr:hypothetical protein [Planctomycetaceae bacterium]